MLLRHSSRFFKAAKAHNGESLGQGQLLYVGVCLLMFTVSLCVSMKAYLLVFKEALRSWRHAARTSNLVIKEAFTEIKRQAMKMTMRRSN